MSLDVLRVLLEDREAAFLRHQRLHGCKGKKCAIRYNLACLVRGVMLDIQKRGEIRAKRR